MAGLDVKYIPLNILQQYFVNKYGFPLAGGKVKFYSDNQRTVAKSVYQLSNNPPDYTYTVLGSELTLSSQGTFTDENGSDISVYAYPYDENGNLELYYMEVYDGSGEIQWTRAGIPNLGSASSEGDVTLINYVPNGQFLAHNYIGEDGKVAAGSTPVAPGGWYLRRPEGSTATDYVTFEEFGSATENPTGNPKFAIRLKNTSPGNGDAYKVLELRYNDVNMFASLSLYYTFSFAGMTNAGNETPITLVLRKNYGVGGSPEDSVTLKANILVRNSYGSFDTPFIFGTNETKTIGDGDYVAIELWMPTSYEFDLSFTNFVLTPGEVDLLAYPKTPENTVITNSIAGFMPLPASDGSDIGLPLIRTREGLAIDYSQIGTINAKATFNIEMGEMLADGRALKANDYSDDGIPYSRLRNKLWRNDLDIPLYGTGSSYLTAYYSGTELSGTHNMYIQTNKAGSVSDTADGAAPTGFTFSKIASGTTNYIFNTYMVAGTGRNNFYIETPIGYDAYPVDADGFTVIDNIQGHEGNYGTIPNILLVKDINSASQLVGKWFAFKTNQNGTETEYLVWCKVGGQGSQPSHSGTPIEIDLLSTDTGEIVALKISQALNGYQSSNVTTKDASDINAGSYFTTHTLTDTYYVWYQKDGAGNDPKISNATGIKVTILGTDTADQVASKTQKAINMVYYALPDLRGMFLRGTNGSINGWDPKAAVRFSPVPFISGDTLGAYEWDTNLLHTHKWSFGTGDFGTPATAMVVGQQTGRVTITNDNSGDAESAPVNISVNYIIKY